MFKFSISLFILFFTFSSQIHAKPIASKDKVNKVSNYFMNQIFNGDVEAAYSILSAYVSTDPELLIEKGKIVANDILQAEKSAGKPLSFDLIETQSVGEHFYKITYLLKYDSNALIWNINYYQPDQGWRLVDVSINTDINALFK